MIYLSGDSAGYKNSRILGDAAVFMRRGFLEKDAGCGIILLMDR